MPATLFWPLGHYPCSTGLPNPRLRASPPPTSLFVARSAAHAPPAAKSAAHQPRHRLHHSPPVDGSAVHQPRHFPPPDLLPAILFIAGPTAHVPPTTGSATDQHWHCLCTTHQPCCCPHTAWSSPSWPLLSTLGGCCGRGPLEGVEREREE